MRTIKNKTNANKAGIQHKTKGSALLLVIAVTVLLSAIGILFIMTSRVRSIATSGISDDRELDAAIGQVTSRIDTVLVQDLFEENLSGGEARMLDADVSEPDADEAYDYAVGELDPAGIAISSAEFIGAGEDGSSGTSDDIWLAGKLDDIWLASLEPALLDDGGTSDDPFDDVYAWPQVTDLWGTLQGQPDSLFCQQYTSSDSTKFFVNSPGYKWMDPDDDTSSSELGDWENYGVSSRRVIAKVIKPDDRTKVILKGKSDWTDSDNTALYGARADADGDGVADSRWVIIPNQMTGRGESIYAAVRIIDNCAMLNLNSSFGFYQNDSNSNPWFMKAWYEATAYIPSFPYDSNFGENIGRYLGEVNYGSFLRGDDEGHLERIRLTRDPKNIALTMKDYFAGVVSSIELPSAGISLFGLGDELEFRNRYLLTSQAISRPEGMDCAYYTFDFGRGEFTGGWNVNLRSKRIPCASSDDLSYWGIRLNPANFDAWDDSGAVKSDTTYNYYYDRRHLCTFYSFDRPIRMGMYWLLEEPITSYRETSSVTEAQADALEEVFRPLNNRPIDLRTIDITSDSADARRNILHLLYAFRDYYYHQYDPDYDGTGSVSSDILVQAARKSAQIVANMIDYLDDNTTNQTGPFGVIGSATYSNYGSQVNVDLTYITQAMIDDMLAEVSSNNTDVVGNSSFDFGLESADVIYGYEVQPFISEVYSYKTASGISGFAMELLNPYNTTINLQNWNIKIGTQDNEITTTDYSIPAATSSSLGRLTIYAGVIDSSATSISTIITGTKVQRSNFGLGMVLINNDVVCLQRPDPFGGSGNYLTVDQIIKTQRDALIIDGNNDTSRKDTEWGFTSNLACDTDTTETLGAVNDANTVGIGYPLPVANTTDPTGSGSTTDCVFPRLCDFGRVVFVGNQAKSTDPNAGDPNAITDLVAKASSEADVRLGIITNSGLLGYFCTLDRTDSNGTQLGLPGRININTAPKYVIAAAIPPQLVLSSGDPNTPLTLAEDIVDHRPYANLGELVKKIQAMRKYQIKSGLNVGESSIDNDLEERDWIVSRLSNIFTVRSDTFTAYILVRLGMDGPQRRMIAIFDRSNVFSPTDRPKLVSLHPVPDPR